MGFKNADDPLSAARGCLTGLLTAVAVWIVVALLVLVLTGTATAAPANYTGKIQLFCTPNLSESAAVDPILAPGVDPFWESQTPAGSESFSDSVTLAEQLAAPTSCDVQSDDSLFWVPTPETPTGTPATIDSMSYYIIEQAANPVTTAPADGTDVLGGNPMCNANACEAGHFNCTSPSGGTWTGQTIPTVADCAAGVGYQETLQASSTPVIAAVLEVGNDGLGGYLSEDINPAARPGESASFDYIYGWQGSALSDVVADCMGIQGWPQTELTCREHLDADGVTRLYQNNPVTNKADLSELVTS